MNEKEKDILSSKAVKAGKRIYYFDVKKNRKDELFLVITESRKIVNEGQFVQFEKHKIFLYKEDFEKFMESMNEMLDYIRENNIVDFVPKDSSSDDLDIIEIEKDQNTDSVKEDH